MARFRKATAEKDFTAIATLADTIWREHYTPIIGKAQVDYMLERFQSATAIARQVAEGMQYFLVLKGEVPVGYLAFQKRGEELFLSKIYVLKNFRGQGFGRAAMDFTEKKARELGCYSISLTVNKNNEKSIQAYLKMGFENRGPQVADIGGGFVMDDYRMVSVLTRGTPCGATGSSPA